MGALVANVGVDLNMKVLGYDPFLSVDAAWRLSRKVIHTENLEELYENCDYISINVPFTDNTHHMLDAEAFAKMKDGVRIINESRAEVVNDADMTEALRSGKVARSRCRIWGPAHRRARTAAPRWRPMRCTTIC